MNFVIEDTPLGQPSLTDEAEALLRKLNVGQSFLVPAEIATAVRNRAHRIPGRFKTRAENGQVRIGRVA